MKEIVIISGKGGTGKTSITAAFSYLAGEDIVVADCDVDAADMHLLMQPDFASSEDFYSGLLANIIPDKCTNCGLCAEICRFDAIPVVNNNYMINPLNCEGCAYCPRICPADAIVMENQNVGKWYISTTKTGSSMVHARLGIGAENSGKLVAKVKNEARRIAEEKGKNIVLVDGSPGIGCPVVSSLSGACFVILVTEPSVSGLHDLKRVYQLVEKFHIKAGCIINKSDLNQQLTSEIEHYLKKKKVILLAKLPYDESFTKAMVNGQTIIEYKESNLIPIVTDSWEKIKNFAGEN
jgi:MinD superfamily P-loop ATPase